ncbi:MAG: metal ABC transporter substrate-binding protein [Solirubrobacterales bacterium]
MSKQRVSCPNVALLAVAGIGLASIAIGCAGGEDGDASSSTASINAVATTTQIQDLVSQVGGADVNVTGILKPNTDPHEYEPRPSDVEALTDADIVFKSGGHLDEWTEALVEDSGSAATVVDVSESLPVELHGSEHEHGEDSAHDHEGEHEEDAHSEAAHHSDESEHAEEEHAEEEHHADEGEHAEEEHGHDDEIDPHWWHDITNAEAAVATIERSLSDLEPNEKETFEKNAAAYSDELGELDRAIGKCVESVPASDRKMVTDHEAFGYLANRYDIEVVGTVIPALTTQAQPSAGDLADLESTINEENVKAIFPESSVSRKLADALAGDTGVSSDYELFGDTLGPEGSGAETYLEMMASNADNLVRGLTGGEAGCG